MSLRDPFLLGIILFFCIKAIKKPYIGVLLLVWIAYMAPHRLTPWSISYSLPLYLMVFLFVFVVFALYQKKDKFIWHPLFIWMLIFLFWGAICTVFSSNIDWAMRELTRFFKIQLGIVLIIFLFQSEQKIKALIWVIVGSLAFYGVKGGIFTVLTGAKWRVWGPEGTHIEGNNELALALLMTIPLMFFLLTELKNKWYKLAMIGAIGLCFISAVGSQSRGALVGLIATSGFLWLKSKMKIPLGIIGIVAVLSFIPFIPDTWWERMETIQTYEEDASAMGRINAWTVAVNISNARITGGGYNFWGPIPFAIYAPNPEAVHDAHSIYFEVLGELGWPGLAIYLWLLWGWWRLASKNAKLAADHEHLKWAVTLSKMSQVAQVAYMSAGAFLGLAYWNMPYHLMIIMILTHFEIKKGLNLIDESKVAKDKHAIDKVANKTIN